MVLLFHIKIAFKQVMEISIQEKVQEYKQLPSVLQFKSNSTKATCTFPAI